MLKLVARGARTKTAKVWRAPYVKGPPNIPSALAIALGERLGRSRGAVVQLGERLRLAATR